MQENKLSNVLHHAIENVPFYMKYKNEGQDVNCKELLTQMPIVEKKDYIDNLQDLTSRNCNIEELVGEFTSGSTGNPLKCYKSYNDKIKIQSSLYRFRKKMNNEFKVSSHYLRLYGSWCDVNIENNAILFSVFYFDRLENYLENIISFAPRWIFGTPSAVIDLINELKKLRKLNYFLEHISLLFVEVTGEVFDEYQKQFIEDNLSVPVINHYGCREMWHIALSCEYGNLHVAEDNVYVQVVNEFGESVMNEEGEILLTSLNCYDIPYIKYRIGDIGKLSFFNCPCGNNSPILDLSGGRVSEYILRNDGSKVSAVLIHHIFRKVIHKGKEGIESYYAKQKTIQEIEFYLQVNEKYNSETEKLIQQLAQEIIGNIRIRFFYNIKNQRKNSGKMHFFEGVYQNENKNWNT